MSEYYTLLGVDRNASQETLRRAYRSHILSMHPDHNPDDALACDRAREIIDAYHVLSNPVTRREYDFGIGYHPHLVVQVWCPEPISSQWFGRMVLVVAFFAILAGLAYGVMAGLQGRTMVFRPQCETAIVAPDPASPTILGRPISADTTVAHEAPSSLAGNIVSRVCVQTALYAQKEGRFGIRFFAEAAPISP